MKETEYDDEEEYSEKHGEDVGITARQQNKSNEGGDPPIKNGRPHLQHGSRCSLLPTARDRQEGVADVNRVVHTETDGNNDIHG